jgi:ribose transport system substrate-binding protein
MRHRLSLLAPLAALALFFVSSVGYSADSAAAAAPPKKIVLGFVAKANSNAVFQVARVGAEAAAKDLSKQYNMDISIDWRTPNDENAQMQADNIAELVTLGASGIAVSCSDANKVTGAINDAVASGVPVVTFDSDAPKSKRFALYGTDDAKCGQEVMADLAKAMGGQGVVAILAGNPNAPNLQKRVQAVKDEAKKYPGITILNVFNHKETAADAAAAVEQAMQANPQITGWAMIGGWPLFTDNALKWAPGTVKCVAVDALPAQLAYVRASHVQELLCQQCYQWGYQSAVLLVDKILNNKTPASPFVDSPLLPVTTANVDAYAKNWDVWLPKK